MGRALELITFQATAPGSTPAAASALTGDSGTIRNAIKKQRLLAAWAQRQTQGLTRITSPLLHDNARGIQYLTNSGITDICIIDAPFQELVAQDTLSVAISGSATAGDIEQSAMLIQYDDLPGIDGNFIDAATLARRAVARFSVTVTLTAVATGQYSTAAAINATEDYFKANTEYAIVGVQGSALCTSYGVRAPDWGNLRIGMFGGINKGETTNNWFKILSMNGGGQCIPVFNSSNKGSVLCDFSDDENAASIGARFQLVELKGR
jgi:hypothetical protein